MDNFTRTANFLAACDKEKNLANVSAQLGQMLWAFMDLLDKTSVSGPQSEEDIAQIIRLLRRTGGAIKRGQTLAVIQSANRAEALASLCAIDAFGNAVAFLSDMDKPGADDATLAATEAMLVDGKPVLAPGGKITTPDGWMPADMKKFV